MSIQIREAVAGDVPALVRVINLAYEVERFFKAGDRTSTAQVAALLERGTFLVASAVEVARKAEAVEEPREAEAAEEPREAEAAGAACLGCVYFSVRDGVAWLSLLSVDPAAQGRGIGAALAAAVEARAAAAGHDRLVLQVVNLRRELFPFYARLGYLVEGTDPFEDPGLRQPCHFVRMAKALRPRDPLASVASRPPGIT